MTGYQVTLIAGTPQIAKFMGPTCSSVRISIRTRHHVCMHIIWMLIAWRTWSTSLIARFLRPKWGPSGTIRTQVGPMLAPWSLLSSLLLYDVSSEAQRRRKLSVTRLFAYGHIQAKALKIYFTIPLVNSGLPSRRTGNTKKNYVIMIKNAGDRLEKWDDLSSSKRVYRGWHDTQYKKYIYIYTYIRRLASNLALYSIYNICTLFSCAFAVVVSFAISIYLYLSVSRMAMGQSLQS